MTAIKKYRRLESKGFWVETEETHPLDVIVSIGKSSIIISDTNEVPLDHWNFNSIMISDKDEKETTFSPGQDRQKKLIIQDEDMIKALTLICENSKISKNPIFKTSSFLIFISTFLILTFIFSVPFILRIVTLDIISPKHETIFIKNLLEEKDFMANVCTKQKETIELENMIFNEFGLVNKIEILVTKNTLSNPLLLPGRMLVIPFTWLEQEQSFKNFKILLYLSIKSFQERRLFTRFLKEQKLSTLFAFNLGIQRDFVLTLGNYYASINKKDKLKSFPIEISDEQWVNIKNSCLN